MGRATATLSGGESQRVKTAKQLGCSLVSLLYILDEPSIGLHPRDIHKLIDTLKVSGLLWLFNCRNATSVHGCIHVLDGAQMR